MPKWAEKAKANGMDSVAARAGRMAVPRLLVGFVLVGAFVLLFVLRGTSVWVTRGLLLAVVVAFICEFVLWREVLFGNMDPPEHD